MPRGDRTGPAGMGPRTGRAAGLCSGYAVPGFVNRGFGLGYGRGGGMGLGRGPGRGRGRGFGFNAFPAWGGAPPSWMGAESWDYDSVTPEQEMSFLKNQAEMLKKDLASVEKRLKDLEKDKS